MGVADEPTGPDRLVGVGEEAMPDSAELARAARELSGIPYAAGYPPFVGEDEASRQRWDLSVGCAMKSLGVRGDSSEAWLAARSLYESDIPTDSPEDGAPEEAG